MSFSRSLLLVIPLSPSMGCSLGLQGYNISGGGFPPFVRPAPVGKKWWHHIFQKFCILNERQKPPPKWFLAQWWGGSQFLTWYIAFPQMSDGPGGGKGRSSMNITEFQRRNCPSKESTLFDRHRRTSIQDFRRTLPSVKEEVCHKRKIKTEHLKKTIF